MSSGQHLSNEMRDLVKSIGETRSKQEEDKIILQEQQKLKDKINDKSVSQRRQRENLIKALYIEMLGHDASFSHIHAINMTQNKQLSLKRLGYLCCCLFLNENSEMLILLVANIQRDLQSTSVHEVVIALTALSKLINSTIVFALVDQILKLLVHPTDLVRKKAVMVLQKIYKINPSLVPDYEEKMRRALCDKEPSVMGAALNLYSEQVMLNPQNYKDTAGSFVLILKQIIEHKLPREFDYHRMPAPWIQIKILQILATLGSNDLKTSEQIYEILGQALRRSDDTGINIGHAVTYQCVKTIATIYPNQMLLELAAQSVSKFLTSVNNNLKYLGINALIQIVQVDSKYVMDHSLTIIDCLESNDETLKRETLELLFKMTNVQNITSIIDRLIVFLKIATDQLFKKNLVNKICSLSEQFAPSQEWFLKTMNLVFEYGAEFVDDIILNNFLKLLYENFQNEGDAFGELIITQYLETVQKPNMADITVKMISWVIGEIGAQIYDQNNEQLNKMTVVLLTIITNEFEDNSTRSWILSALAKLQSCSAFEMNDQAEACFQYYEKSKSLLIQTKARDFNILRNYNGALKLSSQILADDNFAFVDTYVQQARIKGCKEYDKTKSLKVIIGQSQQAETTNGMYFQTKQPTKLITRISDSEVLKVEGNKTNSGWGGEGYVSNKPEPEKPATGAAKFSTNVTNMSSENFPNNQSQTGSAIQGGVYNAQRAPNKPTQSEASTKKAEEEEQAKKEKELKAQQLLLGGTGNVQQQKPSYAQYKANIPAPQETSKPQQSSGSNLIDLDDDKSAKKQQPPVFGNKPGPPVFGKNKQQIQTQVVQQPQTQVIQQQQPVRPANNTNNQINSLIDFGDITSAPQQQQQQQPKAPVYNNIQQQVYYQQPQQQQQAPSFGKPQQQQQQQQPQQQPQYANKVQFSPLVIEVEQYETYWEQFSQEQQRKFQSRVRSEQDLKNMISKLGLGIVGDQGTELICAGKNVDSGIVILCYAVSNPSGALDVTIKTNSLQDINKIFDQIKTGFC